MSVGLILLAAGGSKRLGSPKQLVLFRGKSLLRHAAETALASRCRPVVVVLGAEAERLRRELDGLELTITLNLEWDEGIASSIRKGLEAIDEVSGTILMLCDQPLVTFQALDDLAASSELTAAEYFGSVGVPAFFPKRFFADLRGLGGNEGAKKILLRNQAKALPWPEAAFDVDTIEDLKKLQ